MRKQATVALLVAVAATAGAAPGTAEGTDLSAMVGTWSGQLKSTVHGTFRLLPVEEGRIAGFMCTTHADGSTFAWSFSPEDEPGVVAQVKFGVLQIRQDRRIYAFEIPKPGQDRIRYRARRDGEPNPFAIGRLRRTERTTCADRLISRADAHLEPVPEDEDNPLIGEWSGLWGNGVIDEIQITEIGSWGVTRGVFCELVSNRTAFRFWDLDDRRIGARRTRKGEEPVIAWKRVPARWALRYEKKYRFELVRSDYGQSWAVQSQRYGSKKRNELTMTRGSYRAGRCLARIRPLPDSAGTVRVPVNTEEMNRGR